jgi:alpha-galactosidase
MNSSFIITQAEYIVGDLLVRYLAPADRPAAWGLSILPAALAAKAVPPREWLDAPAVRDLPAAWNRIPAWEVDPLVHLHVSGEAYPGGFAHGRTLRNSATTQGLAVRAHTREEQAGNVVLRTSFSVECGLEGEHVLTLDTRTGTIGVQVEVTNPTAYPRTLEYLGSFSLGGITSFAPDDATGRLWVHRFRSAWCAEGRHEARSVEELNLERSWTGHGVRTERFGQTGSLPVNGWFPVVGLEDRGAGVTWLAQLACPGTWHLEIYRRADQLALAGGGGDGVAGEWRQTLPPGGRVRAPAARLTVVAGSVDDASDRLLAAQKRDIAVPVGEETMPVVYNEWCTSWGHPTHDNVVKLADRLAGLGVKYLVIDDGWAERPGDKFQQNGDWLVNRRAFPNGLRATADAIRTRGLVPGLWFEFEVVNPGSAAWTETAHQLHRHGVPLQVGNRRFWDFRDPWVHDYLATRVLARLRDDGFGYLKVDCNDSIGPGVDGAGSPGENLREHLAGVQRFFTRLRAELPALVIENCSSGGHRLEASMMALTAMSSFSDAHETPDIPLIAANLNRLVCAQQKQIWAVLRHGDSLPRLSYLLAATFLGRMCLSGDIANLGETARAFVGKVIGFYQEVAPVIRDGVFRCARAAGESHQHPVGHQIVTIHAPAQHKLLVVWHRFAAADISRPMALPLPVPGLWRVTRELSASPGEIVLADRGLLWTAQNAWTGGVALLETGD